MSYYVEPNNWTKHIPNTITSDNGSYLFPISVDQDDPAVGCLKEFRAKYRCGRNDGPMKSVRVAKEANGREAKFNCSKEYELCNSVKLVLDNDGRLTLMDGENKELWTNKKDNLNIPESITVDEYKAENGKTGENFLKSGEFLEIDEWIGSPNGKYRLIMAGEGVNKQLQVIYNKLACDKGIGPDEDASSLYTIPISDKTNLGKLGFINREGQLQVYGDGMTGYSSKYTHMGEYNLTGSNLNFEENVATLEDCESKCSEFNAISDTDENTDIGSLSSSSDQCAGFVYKGDEQKCFLKAKEVLYGENSEKRIINDNYQYYLRTKSINDSDISCPSKVGDYRFGITTDWPSENGDAMTPSTKCGLANYTEAERTALDGKYNKLHDDISNEGVVERINELDAKHNTLTGRLNSVKKLLKNTFSDLTNSRKDLKDWSGDQLKQLNAMNEDRDLNMMSENYKHIMWSILAIVIIIGTIKMTKKAVA